MIKKEYWDQRTEKLLFESQIYTEQDDSSKTFELTPCHGWDRDGPGLGLHPGGDSRDLTWAMGLVLRGKPSESTRPDVQGATPPRPCTAWPARTPSSFTQGVCTYTLQHRASVVFLIYGRQAFLQQTKTICLASPRPQRPLGSRRGWVVH